MSINISDAKFTKPLRVDMLTFSARKFEYQSPTAPSGGEFSYLGCGRFSSSSKLSYEDQESVEHPDDLLPLPEAK